MKHIISHLNRAFENRLRLGAMSLMMVNDWVDFNMLKAELGATDGNLASHLGTLEKNEYIEVSKQFVGRKPQTTYRATLKGRKAFAEHLDALERLLKQR